MFVGVTERFNESVKLLEKILPGFFAGATRLVTHKAPKNVNKKSGDRPTPESERYMRRLAKYDVQL